MMGDGAGDVNGAVITYGNETAVDSITCCETCCGDNNESGELMMKCWAGCGKELCSQEGSDEEEVWDEENEEPMENGN